MRIDLTTPVRIHRFAAFAEMAFYEPRPELQALCAAAVSSANQLDRLVVEQVLPGITDAGVRNILSWCTFIGLCDRHGFLSPAGLKAASEGIAPFLEQGVFGFWVTDHPLPGHRIVHVIRIRPDMFTDALTSPIPVRPMLKEHSCSLVDPDLEFELRELPAGEGEPQGVIPRRMNPTCQLRWTIDPEARTSEWSMRGEIDHGLDRPELSPVRNVSSSTPTDGWQLVGRLADAHLRSTGRWLPEKRRLAVRVAAMPESSLESFALSTELKNIDVPERGRFDVATLTDIPVCPADRNEAQTWSDRLLAKRLSDQNRYLTRREVVAAFTESVVGTPLEEHAPVLPAHAELCERFERSRAAYWAIAAGVDLAPASHSPSDLEARRATVSNSTAMDSSVIDIPRQCTWSMRQLAERLLVGTQPCRILLCDRYVRTDWQLESLRVLRDAIHAKAPACPLYLWTERDMDNPRHGDKIKAALANDARWYRDVFGPQLSRWPHARYLLIASNSSPVVWHMSDSPLWAQPLARRPYTISEPLRWRDLLASRQQVSNVPEELEAWLKGGRA
jgi:hypothetical protein